MTYCGELVEPDLVSIGTGTGRFICIEDEEEDNSRLVDGVSVR